jgi:PAS domain S-box-containing protein
MPGINQPVAASWLRLTIGRSPDSIFWFDAEGDIVDANETACRTYGYSPDEFRRMSVHALAPDQDLSLWEDIWHILGRGARYTEEAVHKKKNGTVHPVEVSLCQLVLGSDRMACAFVRDMTKRKRAEQEIAAAYRSAAEQAAQAEKANAALQATLAEVKRLKSGLEDENANLRGQIGHGHGGDAQGGTLDAVIRNHILSTLRATGWRVSGANGAARILGIKPTTLEARMKRLGITRPGKD